MNKFNRLLMLAIGLLLLTLTVDCGRKLYGRKSRPLCPKPSACNCLECDGICKQRRPKKKPCWCPQCQVICRSVSYEITTVHAPYCCCTEGCDCRFAEVYVVAAKSSSEAAEATAISTKRLTVASGFSRDAFRSAAAAADSAKSASRYSSKSASASKAWSQFIASAFAYVACSGSHDVLLKAVIKACACSKASAQSAAASSASAQAWTHASHEASNCARSAATAAAHAEACTAKVSHYPGVDCDVVEPVVTAEASAAAQVRASMCLGVMTAAITQGKKCAQTSADARATAMSDAKAGSRAASKAWSCAKAIVSSQCEGHAKHCEGRACVKGAFPG